MDAEDDQASHEPAPRPGGEASVLAKWARTQSPSVKAALRKVDELPDVGGKSGMKGVPFPFKDRSPIKERFTNREINDAIERAPIERVPLAGLHAIQRTVLPARVAAYVRDPDAIPPGHSSKVHGGPVDLPIVVRHAGIDHLWDGHHRATASSLTGNTTILARYARLPEKDDTR